MPAPVYEMDPNDLAVTKPRRFSAKDCEDLQQLCDRRVLDVQRVEQSLNSA